MGEISHLTEQHVSLLLDLLGMRFSREGKKWLPFGDQMAALGVIVDTSRFHEGSVFLRHTDSRKAELNDTLDRRLNDGNMTSKEAESLRGRLIWFESFIFGRVANLSLHVIGKRALDCGSNIAITAELKRALLFFKDRVVNGPPIEVCAAVGDVMYVFTDGAYEEDSKHPLQLVGSCILQWVSLLVISVKLFRKIFWTSILRVHRTLFTLWNCWEHWCPFCFGRSCSRTDTL